MSDQKKCDECGRPIPLGAYQPRHWECFRPATRDSTKSDPGWAEWRADFCCSLCAATWLLRVATADENYVQCDKGVPVEKLLEIAKANKFR